MVVGSIGGGVFSSFFSFSVVGIDFSIGGCVGVVCVGGGDDIGSGS